MAGKPWHRDPLFIKAGAVIRARANADPTTVCPTCGLTLEQRRRINPGATWDCDHVIPGSLAAGLRARCSTCNRADGARMTNAKRASGYDW